MNEQTVTVKFASPLVVFHTDTLPAPPQVAMITYSVGEFIFKGVSIFMPAKAGQAVSQHSTATMPVGTLGTLSVEWHDASGGTVKVDGPTKWESTDTTVVQVTVSTGNPQIANIYAPGTVGTASVHATADADLGSGVTAVTAIIDITTIAGQAVGGDITFTQGPQGPPSQGGPSRR